MKLHHLFVAAFLVATSIINAQNKEVTLEEIWVVSLDKNTYSRYVR